MIRSIILKRRAFKLVLDLEFWYMRKSRDQKERVIDLQYFTHKTYSIDISNSHRRHAFSACTKYKSVRQRCIGYGPVQYMTCGATQFISNRKSGKSKSYTDFKLFASTLWKITRPLEHQFSGNGNFTFLSPTPVHQTILPAITTRPPAGAALDSCHATVGLATHPHIHATPPFRRVAPRECVHSQSLAGATTTSGICHSSLCPPLVTHYP